MYLEFFGLKTIPFGLSPRLNFLFNSGAFEESMAHLLHGLQNDEAIIMITGPIGSGKTMAIQSFMNQLGNDFRFALVTNTNINSCELLKLILEDLEVSCPKQADKSDLLILFKEYLIQQSRQNKKIILVIDEAQNLSTDSLEEIRLLTNLGQGDAQPVTVVLVGQPELKDNINSPDLEQLRQRIRVHYHLEPLSKEEMKDYVNHRMAVAGCLTRVFSDKSFDRIFLLSGGIPRVVNTLADSSLLSAYVADRGEVLAEDVQLLNLGKSEGSTKAATQSPVDERPKQGKGILSIAAVFLILVIAGSAYFFKDDLRALVASPSDPEVQSVDRSPVQEPERPVGIITEAKDVEVLAENPVVDEEPNDEDDSVSTTTSAVVPDKMVEAIPEDHFYIHISSFLTQERADKVSEELQGSSLGAMVREIQVGEELWYRVYLGPMAQRESAVAEANKLQDAGLISYYKIIKLDSPIQSGAM